MAHSAVLASSASPVLAAMFQNDCKESRSLVVEVEDILPEVFQEVLQFLYTGSMKEMDKFPMDLMVAADKYQIDSLKKMSAASLSKILAVDNAVNILILAQTHDCPELRKSTLNYIALNPKSVVKLPNWRELMENYPELCVEATQFMLD